MKKLLFVSGFLIAQLMVSAQEFRAPAYPLITHDPYFSIWSASNELSATPTRHWTGTAQSITGMAKVDGKMYRFMGEKDKTFKSILPAGDEVNYSAAYTETAPTADWMAVSFDDSKWKKGNAPFGDNESVAKTSWKSHDIWVARTFDMKELNLSDLLLKLSHDDDVEVFINGENVYSIKGFTSKYAYFPINDAISKKLVKGKNVLAGHVANTGGGAMLDVGIVKEIIPAGDPAVQIAQQNAVQLNATQTILILQWAA